MTAVSAKETFLKRQCHKIFLLPRAPDYLRFFSEMCKDIHSSRCTRSIKSTESVVDIGGKVATSVNNVDRKLPPMSMTPLVNKDNTNRLTTPYIANLVKNISISVNCYTKVSNSMQILFSLNIFSPFATVSLTLVDRGGAP
jgi:hypothetical protein